MARPSIANTPATVEAIFRSLPARMRPGGAGWSGTFHWTIDGARTPAWTVRIADTHCEVVPAHEDTPECSIAMSEALFLAIETGQTNPLVAYFKGQIRGSNLGRLRKYEQVFFRFHEVDADVTADACLPERVASSE